MHYIPPTEPIIVAESHPQLLEGTKRVCSGEALAVVMHDAFQIDNLPEVSFTARRLASTGSLHYKQTSERRSTELRSRTLLPILNTSPERHGEKHTVLPPIIPELAKALHAISTGEDIEGAFDYSLDEFRSSESNGVLHTDGSHMHMDVSMHATAVGSGTLFVAGIRKDAERSLFCGTKFFEPDKVYEGIMATPFYPVELRAGTIVVFSAFGSEEHRRPPVLHKVVTTSAIRASASIDQVQAHHGTVPKKLKKELRKAGVNLQNYSVTE
jgi:hypothetical protein